MSEETNQQQGMGNYQNSPAAGSYQDPLAGAESNEPSKKKISGASTVVATVVAVLIFRLFGILGGLICYGGYWAVYGVVRSKMAVATKVILSIVLVIVFVALFLAYIVIVSYLSESIR